MTTKDLVDSLYRNRKWREAHEYIIDTDVKSIYPEPEKFWTKENPHISKGEKTMNIKEKREQFTEIKDVIFNDPATIVFWADGTKTVVKCQEGDEFDPEKGLTMAIVKKVYGNKGSYCNVIKKWCEPYYEKQAEIEDQKIAEALDALAESAKKILNSLPVTKFHYDDPIFETKEDAEKCIENLEAVMKNYGVVTVADMYELAGLGTKISYTMSKYGWTNFRNLEVNRVKHGYVINLPMVTRIDFGESDV